MLHALPAALNWRWSVPDVTCARAGLCSMCTCHWWHKAAPIVTMAGASDQLPHIHNAIVPEHRAHGVHDTSMGFLTNFTLMLTLGELLVQQN